MKKALLFIVFSCFVFLGMAQNTKLTFSEPQPKDKMPQVHKTGKIGNNTYVITGESSRGKFAISMYDEKLKLKQVAVFKDKNGEEQGILDSQLNYFRTIFLKDRILLFFETYETSTKSRMLLCQRMTLDCRFDGELTVIDQISADKKRNSGSFVIRQSEDSTKFLVQQNMPYDKKADEEFVFTTFDNNLKKLSSKNVSLEYKDKRTRLLQVRLSNRGDVYFMLSVAKERDQKKKGTDDNIFMLYTVNLSSDKSVVEYNLGINKKAIVDVAFNIDNERDQIFCSGFYSDIITTAKRTKDIDGFFLMNYSMTSGAVTRTEMKEIPTSVVNQLLGRDEDAKVKDNQGISNRFSIDGIYKKTDGSMLIVSEISWIDVYTTTSSSGMTSTTYVYNNNNIFLISVSADGKIDTFYDIPKRQRVTNTGYYNSFSTLQKGDEFLFVFYDAEKNLEREIVNIKDVAPMKNPNKAMLSFVKLTASGEIEREDNIKLDKKQKLRAVPSSGMKLADGVYTLLLIGSKNYGLIKVEL